MSEDEPTPIQHIVFNRPLSGLPAHLLLASKHSFALKVLLITHDVIPRFGQFGRSVRAGSRFRWCRFAKRVKDEARRVEKQRGIDQT